jgi:hypothetical protein
MPFSKHRRGHTIFMIVFFACLGITVEVFFTAFMSVVNHEPLGNKPLIALAGHSYVWMAFIYGLIPILGVLFFDKIKLRPVWIRLLLYVLIIYMVEFTSGYILQLTTGRCPWYYSSGLNIMGLIRLDYFPAWLLFAWIVEKLYIFINNKVIQ